MARPRLCVDMPDRPLLDGARVGGKCVIILAPWPSPYGDIEIRVRLLAQKLGEGVGNIISYAMIHCYDQRTKHRTLRNQLNLD